MKILFLIGFLNVVNSYLFPNLLPFYYKIANTEDIKNKPIYIKIDNQNLCLFKDIKTGVIKLVNDDCCHRGSSLSSKGTLDTNSGIICGYHGVSFHKSSNSGLTSHLKIIDNEIFFCPTKESIEEPFYIPEKFDKNFRVINGIEKINTNINIFLENVIDNQHIFHVHTFARDAGNVQNLEHMRLTTTHYRQLFNINTGPYSLSNQIQGINKKKKMLYIENEYVIPNNVLSRVKLDEKSTKTVFVRAYPISNNQTIIYWEIYRNFLVYDAELFNIIGDWIFRILFKYTLNEDIGILKSVNIEQEQDKQIHFKYDKIQQEFRKDYKKFIEIKKLDEDF